MAIVLENTYQIGVNNDLSNLANNVDFNRFGEDLTADLTCILMIPFQALHGAPQLEPMTQPAQEFMT